MLYKAGIRTHLGAAPLSITALKICLVLLGYIYTIVGTWLFWDPAALLSWLDISAGLPVNALSEVRSSYGGMYLTLGGFMLWAALTGTWMRGALMLALLTSVGHVFGRLTSLLLDGVPTGTVYGSIALESVVAVYAGVMLYGSKVPHDAPHT